MEHCPFLGPSGRLFCLGRVDAADGCRVPCPRDDDPGREREGGDVSRALHGARGKAGFGAAPWGQALLARALDSCHGGRRQPFSGASPLARLGARRHGQPVSHFGLHRRRAGPCGRASPDTGARARCGGRGQPAHPDRGLGAHSAAGAGRAGRPVRPRRRGHGRGRPG
jgi:hypothetical protein